MLSKRSLFTWICKNDLKRCICQSCVVCVVFPALFELKKLFWVYSSSSCSSFLPAVSIVAEDQTYTVSGAHSPRFCLLNVFFFTCLCIPRHGSRCSSSHPSQLLFGCWSSAGSLTQARRPSLTPAKSKLQWIWFPSFCQECCSHVPWSQFPNHSQECCSECCSMSPGDMVLSFVMPTGIVLIHSVLSMETRLGQVAPLVMVCFACRGSGSGYWGTLWGPLTSRHAQNGPQLPSLAQGRLPAPVGCPVPVFSPGGLLIPPKLPHEFIFRGVGELQL